MRIGEKEKRMDKLKQKAEKEIAGANVLVDVVEEDVEQPLNEPLDEIVSRRIEEKKLDIIPAGIIPGRPGADMSKYNKGDVSKAWEDEKTHDADYADIAGMYLRGIGVYQIAKVMTVNRPYVVNWQKVAYVLKELHQQWQESQLIDIDMAKARELQKTDELEVTYWRAWERSTKRFVETETENVNDSWGSKGANPDSAAQPKKGTAPYSRAKTKRTEKERDGAVEFLKGIQWCIDTRCKILGLNAPATFEVKDWRKEAEKHGVDAGELFDQMVGKAVEQLGKEKGKDKVEKAEGEVE